MKIALKLKAAREIKDERKQKKRKYLNRSYRMHNKQNWHKTHAVVIFGRLNGLEASLT